MKISPNELKRGFQELKNDARNHFNNNKIEASISRILESTTIAAQFNFIYADDELELLQNDISKEIFGELYKQNIETNENRVVFIDEFCTSYVLALQYIQALVTAQKEILYICARDVENMKFKNILNTIKDYPCLTIKLVDTTKSNIRAIKEVNKLIIDFAPDKILLHLYPKTIIPIALYALPSNITKYIINLADQTFWLGAKVIDYTLEFRQFGAAVSMQRRGLKKEQCLLIPFYPTVDNNTYEGLPKTSSDQVILFTGGDFYKTIDKDQTFWNLIKTILIENPKVIFFYAIKGFRPSDLNFVDKFIKDNNFEERFIYIGFRSDINEVFAHCDIYFGTCPASGSLMSQLAAINAKPILQYYYPNTPDDETDSVICYNSKTKILFTNKAELLSEAKRLIL